MEILISQISFLPYLELWDLNSFVTEVLEP